MTDYQPATKRPKRKHEQLLSDGSDAMRDCRHLWTSNVTLDCALSNRCIPCAYKIGCFDVALDGEFCRNVPNKRPEMCPRSSIDATGQHGTLGYRHGMKVLTVGDGDFSFSLAIARLGVKLTATSYEERQTLERLYPGIRDTLKELESHGATVCFQVDATNLDETLSMNAKSMYDRIVWNFPCSAIAKGQDGQNKEMELNKDLVRRFLKNATEFAARHCQIHLNHKTKPPFSQWKIEDVALALPHVNGNPLYRYIGRIVLDRCLLPPYVPRKALDRKSFPVHDACTYVFSLQDMPMSAACATVEAKLTPVTSKVIQTIRDSHLQADASLSRKRRQR